MLRHIGLIAALGLTAAFAPNFVSAGGDKKDVAVKTLNYYPLQVGNRWDYDLTANGNTVPMTTTIARTEKIDDVPLAVLEMSMQGKIIASEHLRQTDKGIIRYRTGQFVPTPPFVLVKYPVKSGDKWDGEFKVGDKCILSQLRICFDVRHDHSLSNRLGIGGVLRGRRASHR